MSWTATYSAGTDQSAPYFDVLFVYGSNLTCVTRILKQMAFRVRTAWRVFVFVKQSITPGVRLLVRLKEIEEATKSYADDANPEALHKHLDAQYALDPTNFEYHLGYIEYLGTH